MLTTYVISFDSKDDFRDFCNDLESYNIRHLIHLENIDDSLHYIVILHRVIYNHFKVQQLLKSYTYKVKSFNRSLSSFL